MRRYIIHEDLRNALVAYLEERPIKEVIQAWLQLKQLEELGDDTEVKSEKSPIIRGIEKAEVRPISEPGKI